MNFNMDNFGEGKLLFDLVVKDTTYASTYLFDTNLSLLTMTNVILVPLSEVDSQFLKKFGYINAYTFSNIKGEEDEISMYLVFDRNTIELNSKIAFDIHFYTRKLIKAYLLKEAVILQYDVSEYEDDIKKCLNGEYSKINSRTKTILTKEVYWLDYEKKLSSNLKNYLYPVDKVRSEVAKRLGLEYPAEFSRNSEVFSLKYKEEETLFIKQEFLDKLLF